MTEPVKNAHNLDHTPVSQSKGTPDTDTSMTSGCMSVWPGQLCPVCGKGIMNYDGLLILSCAKCGFKEPGGGFT